jgi:hypothetical protein
VTAFISTSVDVAPGLALTIDGNGKVTTGGTWAEPEPNALSLPPVATCPGSTAACRASCYVRGLQRSAPEVFATYARNEGVLHRLLFSPALFRSIAAALGSWIAGHCPGGFRWHVSGDVMHEWHARWIAAVCAESPRVQHWIYTRTLGAVPTLAAVPNLAVNVSADAENYSAARMVADHWNTRLCYLCRPGDVVPPVDLRAGDVVFPAYALRGRDLTEPTAAPWWAALDARQRAMVCPADFFGQSEERRCARCRRCTVKVGGRG